MDEIMRADERQKKEKKNVRRAFTPEELRLTKRVKRVMSEIKGEDGKPPSRAFTRVMYDEQQPLGMLGRRLVEARAKKTPLKDAERIIDEVRDWLRNDVYGHGGRVA